MKRIISTALAALLLVGAPLAAYAQAEGGAAAGMEQPSGKKHHKGKKSGGKKGKKKSKEKAPEGEAK